MIRNSLQAEREAGQLDGGSVEGQGAMDGKNRDGKSKLRGFREAAGPVRGELKPERPKGRNAQDSATVKAAASRRTSKSLQRIYFWRVDRRNAAA